MAEVKMDLQELKALEDKVAIANNTIKKKEEEVTDLKLKMKELEANKRIVERTIVKTIRESKATIHLDRIVEAVKIWMASMQSSHRHSNHERSESLKRAIGESLKRAIGESFGRVSRENWEWRTTLGHDYYPDTISIDSVTVDKVEEPKTEYINLEEVIDELRQRAEEKVSSELGRLRAQVSGHEASLASAKSDYKSDLNKLQKKYTEELEEQQKDFDNKEKVLQSTIRDWTKKYQDLQEDKDTRATEQKLRDRIEELEQQLRSNRPWWNKLFS